MTGRPREEVLAAAAAPGEVLLDRTERTARMCCGCAPARSSGSPACSAAAPTAMLRRLFGVAGPGSARGAPSACDELSASRRCDSRRHRHGAGRAHARPGDESVGARQHPAAESRLRCRAAAGSTAPRATRIVAELMELLDIRPRRPQLRAARAVGRQPAEGDPGEMAGAPASRVLLLDEPTQGVDVAAKAQIHALIRDFVARRRRRAGQLQRSRRAGPRSATASRRAARAA